jgi:hypothetical protein
MERLKATICCIALLCASPILTFAQQPSLPQKSVESALTLAETALKNYQSTLGTLRAEPLVKATSDTDAEAIATGGMAIILIRADATKDGTFDLFELVALCGNVDAAGMNAALTAGSLLAKVPMVDPKEALTIAHSAATLAGNAQQLKEASDPLWDLLEKAMHNSKVRIRLTKE